MYMYHVYQKTHTCENSAVFSPTSTKLMTPLVSATTTNMESSLHATTSTSESKENNDEQMNINNGG